MIARQEGNIVCPSCQKELGVLANFCNQCGAKVTCKLSAEEQQEKELSGASREARVPLAASC